MNHADNFNLDPRLAGDCFELGRLSSGRLLLLNNALLPWFILVPETAVTELYELPHAQQLAVLDDINLMSRHLKQNFTVDKLNVAAIGNIVSQLHIHIVGRRIGDCCWPGVVWGTQQTQAYDEAQVALIKSQLHRQHPAHFRLI